MSTTEDAILKTILYADVFEFPLTLEEIHHYLIHDKHTSLYEIQDCLSTSARITEALIHIPPYYALRTSQHYISQRNEREQTTKRLLKQANYYAKWLAGLPFVRMVAVTGALAVRNPSKPKDDLDYFLLVEPGRVWLTRALSIGLVRLARFRGVEICPNYVLASNQLEQNPQDLFIAREITQMIPLYGIELYQAFREANQWSKQYQPNASTPLYPQITIHIQPWQFLKYFGEWLLGGRLGQAIENWEYERKSTRFRATLTEEKTQNSTATISQQVLKGHFESYAYRTLQAYQNRLRHYGLT